MVDEKQMLDCITEASDMGISSLQHVKGRTQDWELVKALDDQIAEYRRDYDDAAGMLSSMGQKPVNTGAAPKLFANLMADVKAATAEDVPSKIAEMVIQGSTMGVTEVTKKLNEYEGGASARGLAQRHLKTQQANIEAMKRFL